MHDLEVMCVNNHAVRHALRMQLRQQHETDQQSGTVLHEAPI